MHKNIYIWYLQCILGIKFSAFLLEAGPLTPQCINSQSLKYIAHGQK